ncbi:hypothetical protein J437_LFUL007060 [Ladona fulva]|uniref:Ig-like and fibronectin type-III domain-containing protein C25G4.10 n=1 Tax=Ladona fulva TaxID=123851 RepID=A0A8K0P1N6_LADFU|nr:hypothetical protein J437_LFUL007060 [Ladona fulva]
MEYEYHMSKEAFARNHNYTDCCIDANVSTNCLGFCSIQSILEGNTGQDPEVCEHDFPAIVRCMADGRNHVPCCIQEGVPDICQDVCRGEYTVITDNIKTHFSCSTYTEQTLACIVEGVELLPSSPERLEVTPVSQTSLKISWLPPTENADTVTLIVINVTALQQFDDDETNDFISSNATIAHPQVRVTPAPYITTKIVKVPGTKNSTIVSDLLPFTMYEVSATAMNIHGSSLPSYSVRTVTYMPNINPTSSSLTPSGSTSSPKVPKLPDVRTCCKNSGIRHPTCLDKLCDPSQSNAAEVTDLMICAPWAAKSFACLTNGQDHSPCCRARGMPALCQELCTGNVTQINFSYFKCLKYMGDFTSCLLQGYGVLPGAPTNVRVSNIHNDFAVLHWDPPKTLADTVTSYVVHYRMVATYDNLYHPIAGVKTSPFLLEGLRGNAKYEFYIEAVNTHGIGEPSSRLVFQTPSKIVQEETELEERWSDSDVTTPYNVTACCVTVKLSDACLPLCSYDASMGDVRRLASTCAPEIHKLIRCGAGGRNHQGCCQRRGVPFQCLSLCSGVMADSPLATATACLPYVGNIVQCFEEGTGLLPGPIEELHATAVSDNSVTLFWEPPQDGSNVTDYVVHYQKMDNTSMHEILLKLDRQLIVNTTSANITGLDTGSIYDFFVVSRNEHGTSMPSSAIMLNVTNTEIEGKGIAAVTSPPHSLSVSSHSATWVIITWQPPEFSHPTEQITYRLYHKSASEDEFQVVETSLTSHMLENLKPNTQYIVYVVAKNNKGISFASETLIAWTDPAYPAFVEPPTVHPINLVIEGSSMTILCIAMGTPMPTISLYISGRLVRQETTRHMVTVVHNVTRDMNQISCYADNGYGTPMQAARRISISYVPHISGSGVTMAAKGDSVMLQCHVDSYPEPKMIFWRDLNGRIPVIHGGKHEINIEREKDEESSYVMTLKINGLTEEDEGDYFCHAENAFGSSTRPVSVKIRATETTMNVTQCCNEQNVSAGCMDACSFFLDIDAVIDKPECINDFDKLMKCAADGSDHRSCCALLGVPKRCLDWCRGEPLLNNKFCVLSYTKQIVSCFHEGRDRLPGPPQNVRANILSSHSVLVSWEPPVKNPNTVEMYRVFWRQVGSRVATKNDTKETSITVNTLKDGTWYEFVVKAGNHLGTSTLTDPVRLFVGDKYITSAASSNVPHISGSGVTMAAKGDSVMLQCHVDSYPEPKMIFWRDLNGRIPVIHGGKHEINIEREKDEESSYVMTLKINGLTEEDEGDYFCHAENAFGSSTRPVSVKIRATETTMNVTQCCNEQNVSAGCMDACSFFLDIDAVIDKPECINDFDKLMKCAAGQESAHVGVIVGVILALAIVAAIVIAVVWFLRTRKLFGAKSNGGVAFENPSYLREVNMDHIQVPSGTHLNETPNGISGANGSATTSISGGSNQPIQSLTTQQGWKQEILHVPTQSAHSSSTEVAPSLYEELKLGHDGAGFRRLKP